MRTLITRKGWLIMRMVQEGATLAQAIKAVDEVAVEHPEWDLTEKKTWEEWERQA